MSDQSRSDLLQQLRKLGVATVTAEYDGCGDNGQIEDPVFEGGKSPRVLVRPVQDLFYDLLERAYGGWEINEGSFGQFTWDVEADRIDLVHNSRIETIETELRAL